jgi:signal transduction histidine kinase
MASDPHDGIWLGLTNGDLLRYRHGQVETFPPNPGAHARKFEALMANADGSVLGATDEGLVVWKAGVRNLLSARNGLPCDDIYAFTQDDAGNWWFYTKCGVIKISNSELEKWWAQPASSVNVQLFDVFDGAQPGPTKMQPKPTTSIDGRLWFANDSIVQMVDPGRIHKNELPPPVHIEQIVADHKNYPTEAGLDLPPLVNELEVDYAALSFVSPQKVRYRYKLEGHDREWQEAGTRRQAFYNDLAPGKYKFRVLACNNDGVWNETGDALNFSIQPTFYQTNWFLFLCVGATLYLAWAIYQWRVRQISRQLDLQFEERLSERTRIAQDLHDTLLQGVLSASMQLHVANDRLAEDSSAKPLVTRVLTLMNRVIDDGRNAVRGLRSMAVAQSLDQAFSRVPQELAVQRPVDFRVLMEGSAAILHPVIRDEVYRIGREALANAFRHSGADNIEVEIQYADRQLRVLIRDNGCGIDEQTLRSGREGHFGLSGMRERAGRIGAKLKVWSRPAGGTEVELSVPGHIAFHSHSFKRRRKWLPRLYWQDVKEETRPGQARKEP